MLDAAKNQLALLLLGMFVALLSVATYIVGFGYFPDSRIPSLATVWVVYGVTTLGLKPSFSAVELVKILCVAAVWPYFLIMDATKSTSFKVLSFFGFIVAGVLLLAFFKGI